VSPPGQAGAALGPTLDDDDGVFGEAGHERPTRLFVSSTPLSSYGGSRKTTSHRSVAAARNACTAMTTP